MSMFASRTIKTIDLPFEPRADGTPHTATIQKLAGRHLGKASAAHFNALISDMTARGGAKAQQELQALFATDASASKKVEDLARDPLAGLDRYVVVKSGVKSWDCDVQLSDDAIEDLDADAIDYLATEIMRLTKPALFDGSERKNG